MQKNIAMRVPTSILGDHGRLYSFQAEGCVTAIEFMMRISNCDTLRLEAYQAAPDSVGYLVQSVPG